MPRRTPGRIVGLGDRTHEDHAFGKLDEDHADIVSKRQEHLAHRFKAGAVGIAGRLNGNSVDASRPLHTTDERPHLRPERRYGNCRINRVARQAQYDQRGSDGFVVGIDVDEHRDRIQRQLQ